MLLNLHKMPSLARPGTSTSNTALDSKSCRHFELIDWPRNLSVFNPHPICYISEMSNLSSLTSAQFKRAAEIKDQIEALNSELAELLGQTEAGPVQPSAPVSELVQGKRKYRLSAAGKAKKVAAIKARWAKVNAEPDAKAEAKPVKRRKKMSAEGRTRIVLAAKTRWARVREGKVGK